MSIAQTKPDDEQKKKMFEKSHTIGDHIRELRITQNRRVFIALQKFGLIDFLMAEEFSTYTEGAQHVIDFRGILEYIKELIITSRPIEPDYFFQLVQTHNTLVRAMRHVREYAEYHSSLGSAKKYFHKIIPSEFATPMPIDIFIEEYLASEWKHGKHADMPNDEWRDTDEYKICIQHLKCRLHLISGNAYAKK